MLLHVTRLPPLLVCIDSGKASASSWLLEAERRALHSLPRHLSPRRRFAWSRYVREMADTNKVEALIRELDAQREAYMNTFQQVHELLAQNLAATASSASPPRSGTPAPQDGISQRSRRSTIHSNAEKDTFRKTTTGLSTVITASSSKEDGSEDEDDQEIYVQNPLPARSFDEDGFRRHLRHYPWNTDDRKILEGVVGNPSRIGQRLIPNHKGPHADRSHYSHFQVYDVASDGSPLLVDKQGVENEFGRAMALWAAIREVNPSTRTRQAVGRITVICEPSPILFGAVHYTMQDIFDVDELFRNLVETSQSSASTARMFHDDERRQRSLVFSIEYFTLIGKDCEPMQWQLAANQEDRKPGHIAITRCSSVLALSLRGPQIKKIKNPARQKTREYGHVYDPFSPWEVLNLQCYPDWKASLDVHDSTKHYANGPEAFMNALLGELRDAERRFEDIYRRISARVTPPLDFMFDTEIRDRLLFEDDGYTMVRRYFWAHQTLGIMNESLKAMVDAYEDTFTDDVWEGRHKTLWPILDPDSQRSQHYKKKMAALRREFDIAIVNLRKVIAENNGRRREIIGLREELFSGTSIQESRKSVMATETTVQQGHNIKLLTLVSMCFLPLTFVTSVFG